MQKCNELQSKILEIVIDFDKLCKANNIKYFLMGGSALGCARHQGFIPWDDDFDVFMDPDNYRRFVQAFRNYGDSDKYYLQEGDTRENPLFITKIRANNTLIVEDFESFDSNIHNGVFIDIMVLHRTPKSKLLRFIQYIKAKLLVSYTLSRRGYSTQSLKKKTAIIISKVIVGLWGKDRLFRSLTKYDNNADYDEYCHLFGRASYSRSYYKKEWFENSVLMSFERYMLPMMSGYKEYLTIRYGEKYMDNPSQSVIDSYPSHAAYFNLHSSKFTIDKKENDD